jgi:hypothetical protein
MLALLSLVAVGTLARRRQPTQPRKPKRVFSVVDTTQRLGIFGFAQSNVIYDFYQKEVNVFDACRLTYRPQVARASWQGRPTRPRPRQMLWRETFKCDALRPILGKALPDLRLAAYLDHHDWNPTWTSALGWSMLQITSSDPTAPSAYHVGQYGSVIALNAPIPHAAMGNGLQWTYERDYSFAPRMNGECMQATLEYDFSKQ